MAHFTQLNLNSKQESKQSDATKASSQKRKMMAEEKAVLLGSLVIICLTSGAVLLTTQGCSRANEKATVANQMPQSPAVMPSAPAASAPTAPATDTKKKHKRLAIVTYKDGNSGLSFRYPRKYTIKSGNSAKEDLAGLGPVPMNFSEAGGKTLATIEVNDTFFPGTDLKSAFVNVSVNPTLDATECSQFAVPVHTEGETVPALNVKLGENEFTFVEDFDEANAEQPIGRYYHAYENGRCYEFALGIATDGNADKEEVRPIDRDAVFEKLTKIVASAQIKSTDDVPPATPSPAELGHATQPEPPKSESAKTDAVTVTATSSNGDDNR